MPRRHLLRGVNIHVRNWVLKRGEGFCSKGAYFGELTVLLVGRVGHTNDRCITKLSRKGKDLIKKVDLASLHPTLLA